MTYVPGYNTQEQDHIDGDETLHEGLESTYIHHDPQIIALGCSFTSGQCIPPEHSWPHIIGTLQNKKVLVIATAGIGLNWLWNNYIRYTTEYGLPEQVFLLTPDLKRYSFKSHRTFNNPNQHQLNWHEKHNNYKDHNKTPNIRQHNGTRNGLHTGLITHTNLQNLDNITHHTTQNNIPYTHTTWNHTTHTTLTKLNYPHYKPINTTCNHQPQTPQQHHWWNHSTDNKHGGMHDQIHIAQTLLQHPITNQHLTQLP